MRAAATHGTSNVLLYEYPFNEGIRTMLRLEHLFDRLGQLLPRDAAVDHHFALATIFEIMDVAGRADLKSDLMRELERHRGVLEGWRSNPHVSSAALGLVIGRIEQAQAGLNALAGKAGQALTANEWLMSIRSRIGIPGGTCEFDLPAYYAWQQRPGASRRADLQGWLATLTPLAEALQVLLQLLRESGSPHKVVTSEGSYQQSLAPNRGWQLLRLRIDEAVPLIPEISGHRLMVSIRMMRQEADGKLRPAGADATLELTLCG